MPGLLDLGELVAIVRGSADWGSETGARATAADPLILTGRKRTVCLSCSDCPVLVKMSAAPGAFQRRIAR